MSAKRKGGVENLDNWIIKKSLATSELQQNALESELSIPNAPTTSTNIDTLPDANVQLIYKSPNQDLMMDVPNSLQATECYQPNNIPNQLIGNRQYKFNTEWYKSYPWIHFDTSSKKVICMYCLRAKSMKLFSNSTKLEETFISSGFNNWKYGTQKLKTHESSKQHIEGVFKLNSQNNTPISVSLSNCVENQQNSARIALSTLFSTVQFLAKQGLALQGHDQAFGNYRELLKLRSEDCNELKQWLTRTKNFTSCDIQNEMLQIMSLSVVRQTCKIIQTAGEFSLIVDETSDISVSEQVSICIRTVDSDLNPEEYFMGLYKTESTTAETLISIILDSLQRFGLDIKNLRGQCFDGAANMKGHIRGVQARILQLQPKAIYVHCYNHSLNLAVQDVISIIPLFRDAMNYINEIGVIVKSSPKRFGKFLAIANEQTEKKWCDLSPRPLCPTRWTVRVKAIKAILNSYQVIFQLLEDLKDSTEKIASKAAGLYSQMEKGQFYLILLMAKIVFDCTEILSLALQNPESTVCGAREAATVTCLHLVSIKTKNDFEILWTDMESKVKEMALTTPCLPRKKQPSSRFRASMDVPREFMCAKDLMESVYYNVIENVLEEINERFEQESIKMYGNVENLLLFWNKYKTDADKKLLATVAKFYDWNADALYNQLNVFENVKKSSLLTFNSVKDFVKSFQNFRAETKSIFPDLFLLIKTLVVVPCSSATSERSFSMLRRIKTYLRSTMGQARLNHCCLLHGYPDFTERLHLKEIMLEFINNEYRCKIFGNII